MGKRKWDTSAVRRLGRQVINGLLDRLEPLLYSNRQREV
jgi:hypothetical protein